MEATSVLKPQQSGGFSNLATAIALQLTLQNTSRAAVRGRPGQFRRTSCTDLCVIAWWLRGMQIEENGRSRPLQLNF